MIYQYDQAIEMPTMNVYDNGLLGAYLNSVEKEYKQGLKDQQEFITKYGDFMSPSKIDVENYYKLGIGRVQDAIQKAYDNGIDILRSQEGRQYLNQVLNSIPYQTLAQLKQSAKAQEEFNKAKQQLAIQGLYNPDLSKYEGGLPEDYDTLQNGAWNIMSPTPYRDAATFSKAYFDGMQPVVKDINKNGLHIKQTLLDDDMLRNVAEQHFNDLVNTPQGRLMYKMFLDKSGGDENMARKMFDDTIVAGNAHRKINQEALDDQWLARQNLALQKEQLELKKQETEFNKAMALAQFQQQYAGNSFDTQTFTDQMDRSVELKRNQQAGSQFNNVLDAEIKRWEDLRDKYRSVGGKMYKRAIDHISYWKRAKANPRDAHYGLIDQYGNFTSKYIGLYDKFNKTTSNTKPEQLSTSIKNADYNYNQYTYPITGGADGTVLNDSFLGKSRAVGKINSLGENYNTLSFRDSNLKLSVIRRMGVRGRSFRYNNIVTKFQNWLRQNNIVGYKSDSSLGAAIVPKGRHKQLDIYGNISISKDDLNKFRERYGYSDDDITVLKDLIGANETNKSVYVNGNPKSSSYVTFSITRTIDNNGGSAFKQIDDSYNKLSFGTTNAYKENKNTNANSVMK